MIAKPTLKERYCWFTNKYDRENKDYQVIFVYYVIPVRTIIKKPTLMSPVSSISLSSIPCLMAIRFSNSESFLSFKNLSNRFTALLSGGMSVNTSLPSPSWVELIASSVWLKTLSLPFWDDNKGLSAVEKYCNNHTQEKKLSVGLRLLKYPSLQT